MTTPSHAPTAQSVELPAAFAAITEPEPVQVTAPSDSRLAALQAQYAEAKSAADAASERLKDITDALKLELTTAAPEQHKIELTGGPGPAMRLTYVERWTVDTRRLKSDAMAAAAAGDDSLAKLYAGYAKKGGAWTLRTVGGDR